MFKKVAIVEVAQISGGDSGDNFYDQAYRVTKEVLDKAGLKRDELETVVSAASDIFHGGISCANSYYWESVGATMKDGSRQDAESIFALWYSAMRIMSGRHENALAVGLCKGSENPENDILTHYFSDPFYQRGVGLNESIAAALQMRMYMERYGITEEQCAKVAVKNFGNAMRNPYAHRKGKYSIEDILNSKRTIDPLTELQCAPKSEGMVAVLLASEERAKKLTDKPIWIKGYGCSLDTFYLGDRDLVKGKLREAAKAAYKMAGIHNPIKDIDVAEITEPYAFQELIWCEDLGFCNEGEGGKLIDSEATQINGNIPVNPSGGVLATNPYISRGLHRVAEATLQLRGQAGDRQVDKKVKTALAHGTHGFAGQCHVVVILGR